MTKYIISVLILLILHLLRRWFSGSATDATNSIMVTIRRVLSSVLLQTISIPTGGFRKDNNL